MKICDLVLVIVSILEGLLSVMRVVYRIMCYSQNR